MDERQASAVRRDLFDAIYALLLRIATAGRAGKKHDVGKKDVEWRPTGFPTLQRLLQLAGDPTK